MIEEEIKQAFIKAVNLAIVEKEELIENAKIMMEMVCDSSILKEQEQHLLGKLDILVEQIQKIIRENSRVAMNQEEYQARYEESEEKYNRTKEEYDKVADSIRTARETEEQFNSFIATLENADEAIAEFDEAMWSSMIECMTMYQKDNIVFSLIGGMEVTVSLTEE